MEIETIVVSAVGGAATLALSVIGFLLKRELIAHDDQIKLLITKSETLRAYIDSEIKEKGTVIEGLRRDYEVKMDKFLDRISESLNETNDKLSRTREGSQHDLGQGSDKILSMINDLRVKLDTEVRDLERLFYEYRTQANEKFVLKIEFARETTALDTHIASTKRTLDNLDVVLGEYLKKG